MNSFFRSYLIRFLGKAFQRQLFLKEKKQPFAFNCLFFIFQVRNQHCREPGRTEEGATRPDRSRRRSHRDRPVLARDLSQNGRALLHREGQGPSRTCCPKENRVVSGSP